MLIWNHCSLTRREKNIYMKKKSTSIYCHAFLGIQSALERARLCDALMGGSKRTHGVFVPVASVDQHKVVVGWQAVTRWVAFLYFLINLKKKVKEGMCLDVVVW